MTDLKQEYEVIKTLNCAILELEDLLTMQTEIIQQKDKIIDELMLENKTYKKFYQDYRDKVDSD